MLGFAETLGAILGSFLVPAFVGIAIMYGASRYVKARYLAAFAVGLYLWFFTDTISDASFIGVDEGFSGGIWHVALWLAFAIGLTLVFYTDREVFTAGPSGATLGFGIPLLVAFAVGMHGFGEGASIGATAAVTPSTNLIDAFGGLSAAVAFILHKGLEPMMVGAAYVIYAKDHAQDLVGRLRDIIILMLVFTIPGIIGGASAYYVVQVFPGADFTYFFAFGLGTSLYALFRLAKVLFEVGGPSGRESIKTILVLLLGFTCLYLAALLHS